MLVQKGGIVFGEMQKQPQAWSDVIAALAKIKSQVLGWLSKESFAQVLFLGQGDTYSVAQGCAAMLEQTSGLTARSMSASEILYLHRPPYDTRVKTLVITFYRPDNVDDILWATQKLKKMHKSAKFVALTPPPQGYKPLADSVIKLPIPVDEGVVKTRTTTTLLVAGLVFVSWLSNKPELEEELGTLKEAFDLKLMQQEAQQVSVFVKPPPVSLVGLASGPFEGAADYAILKAKEMGDFGGYATSMMEFRHHRYAGVHNTNLVLSYLSEQFRDSELRMTYQLAKLKVPRVLFGTDMDHQVQVRVEGSLTLPSKLSELARLPLAFAAGAFVAFYLTLSKGNNPDKPHHLDEPIVLEGRPDQ